MSKSEPSLYQRFLDEREEILKYKWLESEKQGYDIGFEQALRGWVENHRRHWLEEYKRIRRNPPGQED